MIKLVTNKQSGRIFPTFLFEPLRNIDFLESLEWQNHWQEMMLNGIQPSQAVWMLQHQSCYTLGRGSHRSNILFDINKAPSPLHIINRGGEVTHHAPGQLVIYLALDLKKYKKDLAWYLRELEDVLIKVLHELGLKGYRIKGKTGVWIDGLKVAAIGIGCKRWITQHGVAVNIRGDMSGFNYILPCGLRREEIGAINDWLPNLTVDDVKPLMKKYLQQKFDLGWIM